MRIWKPIAGGVSLLLLACGGLGATVEGSLLVDGQPFNAVSCTSGSVFGFSGVELRNEQGEGLRIVTQPDDTATVVLLPAGVSSGIDLGPCGTAGFRTTSLTINDVAALEGQATLQCEARDHEVSGTVQIGRCATELFKGF
ncbi:MAG: hypothetical protein EA397_11785 [Deltaproteobacteria bacterium]|nr:MAG: hypothetical protein EA397_11785 [Deltaproteobacteria bacterium]